MMNCWTLGISLALFLIVLCLWNCYNQKYLKNNENWHGCFDQSGDPVDFFTIYKLPQDHVSSVKLLRDGTAYMYLTPDSSTRLQSGGVSSVLSSNDFSTNWVLSNISIGDKASMVGRTLNQLYNVNFKDSFAYFMYNDEFPNGTVSFNKGHSKGVLVLSNEGGFWLVHSVPKFPPPPEESYSYPHTGHKYGQSILCVSLPPINSVMAKDITQQLVMNQVFIYSSNAPKKLMARFPMLNSVTRNNKNHYPFYSVTKFASVKGKIFTSFAKNKNFGKDLYSKLIAPTLKTDLYVETWRNGPHPLPSACNETFSVENIKMIDVRPASFLFSTHSDHSKWAVSKTADNGFICIGDINRMETQYIRGGGSVCIQSLSIWNRFKSLIEETETCPKHLNF